MLGKFGFEICAHVKLIQIKYWVYHVYWKALDGVNANY